MFEEYKIENLEYLNEETLLSYQKEGYGYIYGHLFPNGKWYIGQTIYTNMLERWGTDGCKYLILNSKKKYRHPKIARAINHYGWENVKHYILYVAPKEKLSDVEIEAIQLYNSYKKGYNCTLGGDAISMTDEIKEKLSKAAKKRKDPPPMFGKHFSEESRKKISESLKNHEIFSKPVYQFNKNDLNNPIKKFPSVKEAERETGINCSCISKCCNNIQKIAGGFKWSFTPTIIEAKKQSFREVRIEQYSLNGEKITEFNSAADAGRSTNISPSSIIMVCKGKRKTAGKFIWKYLKEDKLRARAVIGSKDGVEYYFNSASEAAKSINYPFSFNILKCCSGDWRKTAGGYTWKFADENKKE